MKFKDLLNPEERIRLERRMYEEALRRQQLSELTDEELVEKAEHYMKNSFGLTRVAAEYRDSPTYDSALWYFVIPEMIRRLGDHDTT